MTAPCKTSESTIAAEQDPHPSSAESLSHHLWIRHDAHTSARVEPKAPSKWHDCLNRICNNQMVGKVLQGIQNKSTTESIRQVKGDQEMVRPWSRGMKFPSPEEWYRPSAANEIGVAAKASILDHVGRNQQRILWVHIDPSKVQRYQVRGRETGSPWGPSPNACSNKNRSGLLIHENSIKTKNLTLMPVRVSP